MYNGGYGQPPYSQPGWGPPAMPFNAPPPGYGSPPPGVPGSPPMPMPYGQPFPPPPGFPGAPPFGSQMPMHMPPGMMPPMQQHQQHGGPPRHAGIGAVGQAPNVAPVNAAAPSPYAKIQATGDKFPLFVSSIAEGLEDYWVERLLNCAGPLVSLKRLKDASQKPKPMAFAEYGNADSVLRCLEVVNGVTLPGKDGVNKPIAIKADEKVRARLDNFESTRLKTDEESELLRYAQDQVKEVLHGLGDPAQQKLAAASMPTEEGPVRRVPNHLQDLGPEDLPKESRGLITSEIAFFRQRIFDKKGPDEQREELEKIRGVKNTVIGQLRDPNRPDRPYVQQQKAQQTGPPAANAGAGRTGSGTPDPQSFNKPVAFVAGSASGSTEAPKEPEISDEERERRRVEAKRRDEEAQYRERVRRWEQRERSRQSAWDREQQRERQQDQDEERQRSYMRRHLAEYDDEKEAERGRELFYADRAKWRAQRRAFRQREADEDARDAELEAEQIEALKRQSEAFLNKQADFFAKLSSSSKTGASLDDTTHIKLSLAPAKPAAQPATSTLPPAKAVVFSAADEEEEGGKKKRALIPLTYDDIVEDDVEVGMSTEQKLERRKAKVRELVESIPADKDGLWAYDIKWDQVPESAISTKLSPFVQKKCVEVLGMEEDEIVNAVLDHVRAHKSAAALVEELEPVLADEAVDFVIKIWRFVIFESLAAQHGIETST